MRNLDFMYIRHRPVLPIPFWICLLATEASTPNVRVLGCDGCPSFVSLQAIINMGVVTGSMPTKGMSLPFISYGGSNLMVTFIFLGLIVNVFRRWDNPRALHPREL